MKNTYYTLLARVYTLNDVLERPLLQFSSKVGEPTKFSVGHFCLNHDSNGYNLEEQVSEAGGVNVVACGYTAHEMDVLLTGIMKGIGFRNIQFAEQVQRYKDRQNNLSAADAPYYPADAAGFPATEPQDLAAAAAVVEHQTR